MHIQVMYADQRYDLIKASQLEDYIRQGKIIKFKRSSGWVTVGVDPLRGRTALTRIYTGPERRRVAQNFR